MIWKIAFNKLSSLDFRELDSNSSEIKNESKAFLQKVFKAPKNCFAVFLLFYFYHRIIGL